MVTYGEVLVSYCRSDPPKHWPKAAYLLVSRADLATPVAPRPVDVSAPHSKHPDLVAEMNADKIAGLNAAPAGHAEYSQNTALSMPHL
jgi:hypothetical protein